MALEYRHKHILPMLAGVGLHPWFSVDENDTALSFSASGQFDMGADQFPVGHHSLSSKRRPGVELYTRWIGHMLLRVGRQSNIVPPSIPDTGRHCGEHKPAPLLCLTRSGAICAERVTRYPNAPHDCHWWDINSMPLLMQGKSIKANIQIQLRRMSPSN